MSSGHKLYCLPLVFKPFKPKKMASKFFRALIMGPPGSGKGTISSRIIRDFDLSYISSGDLLRSHMLNKTTEGVEAKKYIEKGRLVPDVLITQLILKELESVVNTNWLLDGFPRTVSQAEVLSLKFPISRVLNLDVPDSVIIDRLKGRWLHATSGRIYHTEFNPPKVMGKDDITGESLIQRDDDKPETVKARLEGYKNETRPVLEYYQNKRILKEFHGRESNEIWPRVQKYLMDILPPSAVKVNARDSSNIYH